MRVVAAGLVGSADELGVDLDEDVLMFVYARDISMSKFQGDASSRCCVGGGGTSLWLMECVPCCVGWHRPGQGCAPATFPFLQLPYCHLLLPPARETYLIGSFSQEFHTTAGGCQCLTQWKYQVGARRMYLCGTVPCVLATIAHGVAPVHLRSPTCAVPVLASQLHDILASPATLPCPTSCLPQPLPTTAPRTRSKSAHPPVPLPPLAPPYITHTSVPTLPAAPHACPPPPPRPQDNDTSVQRGCSNPNQDPKGPWCLIQPGSCASPAKALGEEGRNTPDTCLTTCLSACRTHVEPCLGGRRRRRLLCLVRRWAV